MRNTIIYFGLIALLITSGCATSSTLDDTRAKAPERVKTEVLDYPFQEVREAAKESITNLGLMLDREAKKADTTALYAKSGTNLTKVVLYRSGFGEMVAIYLTPLSETQTKVEVVLQKSNRLEVGFKDYRELVIKQIELVLTAKARID